MALYEWGGPVISSTGAGEITNSASTATNVAVIDSTQLSVLTNGLSGPNAKGIAVRLSATLGGNSSAAWRVEQSASSTITDAPRLSIPLYTPAGQSGLYVWSLMLEPGDLIRARSASTYTGTMSAFLQVDPLS